MMINIKNKDKEEPLTRWKIEKTDVICGLYTTKCGERGLIFFFIIFK